MKIIGEGEYGRRVCIDLGLHLNPRMAWQCQADNQQQDNETGYCVNKFLHVRTAINRGAGLFHSTMPG